MNGTVHDILAPNFRTQGPTTGPGARLNTLVVKAQRTEGAKPCDGAG